MPDRISESDLLALIEGTLPTERIGEMREVLRQDPALCAHLARLRADRDLLASLPDALPAPAHAAEAAMRRAAEVGASADRAPARRRTAMLAAAGIGIAILAGLVAVVFAVTNPAVKSRIITVNPGPRAPEVRLANEAPGPLGPEPVVEDADLPKTTAQDIAERLATIESTDAEDPLLEQFLTLIDEHAEPSSGEPEPALAPSEIVALLREGSLGVRITADETDAQGALVHADADAAHANTAPGHAIPSALAVDVPVDAADADIMAALERAVRPWRARSGFHVDFVRAGHGDTAPRPASDPHAVVWWAGPPETWRTMRTLTLPVVVRTPALNPDAPSPPASD